MQETAVVTKLMRLCLQLNYEFQAKVFRYAQPFYFDNSLGKFVSVNKVWKLLPWFFINFLLLPYVACFCTTVVYIGYFSGRYRNLNILQMFILVSQFLLCSSSATCAYCFFWKRNDWVNFLNHCFPLDSHSRRSSRRAKGVQVFKSTLRNHRELAYKTNGKLDGFGILMIGILSCLIFFYFSLPPFVFIFELDAPYHFFSFLLPPAWYGNPWSRSIIFVVRIFIGTWSIYEGSNNLRNLAVCATMSIYVLQAKLQLLRRGYLSQDALHRYRRIALTLAIINESFCIILPAILGLCYFTIVMVAMISVLGVKTLDWMFYTSIPAVGTLMLFVMVIVWHFSTTVDDNSKKVKHYWKMWMFVMRSQTSALKMRAYKMEIRALRPVSIKYGSLGTMKLSTRRDYFHALVRDSAGLILAMKDADLF